MNLLGNPPKVTHEPITRIIRKQLDIKRGQFTPEEPDSVRRKIENRKAKGLNEIPPEKWKIREFDDIVLRHYNALYNQNTIDRWTKGCILPFPNKCDVGLAKNYRGITLSSMMDKIYNALLRNRIEPKIENILRKNQNGFRINRSTTSQISTICRILEGVCAKNLEVTILFVDFSKAFDSIHRWKMEQILLDYGLPKETVAAIMILCKNTKSLEATILFVGISKLFDSIHRGKMEQILLAYGLPKETVESIMMLYKNTKVKVCSPYRDTDYFDIVAGVLQGDTLALYLFVISLDVY